MFEAIRARCEVVGACWIWQGSKDRHGYGQKRINNLLVYTHRYMFEAVHGPSPEGKHFALHSCDTPACCNPAHLSWGDRSRNAIENRDRLRTHAMQKLTRDEAHAIKYTETGSQAAIARRYGVSRVTVNHIRKGRQWADL